MPFVGITRLRRARVGRTPPGAARTGGSCRRCMRRPPRTDCFIRRSLPRGTICLGSILCQDHWIMQGGFHAAAATLSTCGQAARLERVACRGDVTDLRERDGRGTVGRGCRLGPRANSIGPPRTVSLRRRVRRFLQREATGETASQDRGQAAILDGRARHRLWLSAGQLHSWPIRDPVRALSDQAKPVGRRPRLLACDGHRKRCHRPSAAHHRCEIVYAGGCRRRLPRALPRAGAAALRPSPTRWQVVGWYGPSVEPHARDICLGRASPQQSRLTRRNVELRG
jgi:hypothetical protein